MVTVTIYIYIYIYKGGKKKIWKSWIKQKERKITTEGGMVWKLHSKFAPHESSTVLMVALFIISHHISRSALLYDKL